MNLMHHSPTLALKGRDILTMDAAHRRMMGVAHRRMMGVAHREKTSIPLALKGRDILTMVAAHRHMMDAVHRHMMGLAHREKTSIPLALKGPNKLTMGQSLVKNYIHIVFSTKYRQPLIDDSVEAELHAYLGGICNRLECTVIKVGGYTDHIHILCLLSKKITLMKLMEQLKSNSSKWIKTKGTAYQNFYWQDGYGAFAVNPRGVDRVIDYISNQHEHHDKKKSFQEEYRDFLERYQIEYDERYVWD